MCQQQSNRYCFYESQPQFTVVVVGEEEHSTFAAVPGASCTSAVDTLLAVESSQPSVACSLLSVG